VTSYKDVTADVHHQIKNKNKHVTLPEENTENDVIVPKALREFVQEYRMKSKSNLSSSGDNSNSFNNIHTNSKHNNNNNNSNKNKKEESDISLLNDIRNNFVNKQYNVTTNQQNNQVLRDVAKFFLGTTHNNILENEQPLKANEKCLNYLLNGCPSFTDSLSNTNKNINQTNNSSNNNINSNEYLMNCKEIATK